nr:putative ribonuclease H-like domain-containing protein [Tanacetum cinerariifolium]
MLRDNTSSKNLSKLLESQVRDNAGLGFNSQVFDSQVFDCEELHNHESDNRVPKNPKNDRYKPGEGYHAVPPLYTGTFLPLKPDLVIINYHNSSDSVANVFNVESSTNEPSKDMSKTLRPDAPIVEDWISDSKDETKIESVPKQRESSSVKSFDHVKSSRESSKKVKHPKQSANLETNNQKSRVRMTDPHSNRNVVPTAVLTRSRLVSLNAAKPVPTAITQLTIKSTWLVKHVVNKAHSPVRRLINQRTATKNSNFNKKVTTVKVNKGNLQRALKDKGNPKGGKIYGKGKIKTGKLDFDDVYFVKEIKFNLFSVSQIAPVNVVGSNLTNSTNSFNTASPSDPAVSLKFRIAVKSSFVDLFKYPNDPNIHEVEDIVYSDDEEDVGAEDDLSNLETNISVSPIPTTRVHKDHPVTQIINDLTSGPQIRSMTRMMDVKSDFLYGTVKEEGNGFQRGKIDQTLFIKKKKGYILLVQVYVDDIIFGSTNKKLCKAFEKLMNDKFQMSSMGEHTFFLGLQVNQKDDGIFISQDKYVAEILRKFSFTDVKSASTPIETEKPLLKDLNSKDVMFIYTAYSDSDYAGSSLDWKSITGGCQFLGCRLISWQCKKKTVVATSSTEAEYVAAASCCTQVLWI